MPDESQLILRYLTDLDSASSLADDDLLHVNQGGEDLSITVAKLAQALILRHYPVGKVMFFANTVNPNSLFPGTTWTRVPGSGKTIRLAADDNSDIMSQGGSDMVQLEGGHLPPHTHWINLTTQPYTYGTVGTTSAGYHNHAATCGYAGDHQHQGGWGAPGAAWANASTGSDNQKSRSLNWTSQNGGHTHPVDVQPSGEHTHTVTLPAHSHVVTGSTGNAGSSAAFSVVNAFIKLAGWYRTA